MKKDFTTYWSYEHVGYSFHNLVEILSTKVGNKLLSIPKRSKTAVFFRKKFPSKCFFGQVEWSFHNFADKISTKSQNLFAHFPKKTQNKQKFFRKKSTFVKLFLWTRKKQFWQPHRSFWNEGQNYSFGFQNS